MNPRRFKIIFFLGGIAALALIGGVAFVSNQEQDDQFCASCHTQPESEYLARFQNALAQGRGIDLAAFHHRIQKASTRCIDCHGGEGLLGRAQVITISALDAFKHYTGLARQPAVIVIPVQNEACIKCHEDFVHKTGFENHMHNKMLDPDAPFLRCTDCHVTHRQGDERNGFQFRDAIFPQCEYCHVQMQKGPRGLK
ncbi:MAG: hypothetical protein HY070_09445 [Chloroflexi bacterium]|nr:hypothetical protein [Chloroflexota bacterium]MBI3742573.1 hypothetical protein [Chloroflexota bacterium]